MSNVKPISATLMVVNSGNLFSQRDRRDRRWRFNPAKCRSEEAGRTGAAESEARLQAAVDQALLEQGSWASNYHNFVASLTG
ncbi:hypothetical protein FXB40_03155 [Bradyrhizobium rifense]|uniref:Uncharacterized protein n=1 Tax=Bradyrhizobium rifense TaxID=515499 RepID=A0A5D3KU35_9BRAD|nr:hypothetical protein [Bradyrhizobium rifense]TYL99134.1 hypothetical protein FXB40_03155 [Bradyrhizobium rifense]